MKFVFNLLFLVLVLYNSRSEEILIFKPLTANTFEPRIGTFYNFDDENLRLDIGATFDLLKYDFNDYDIAFGADFFTYTRLRSEENFKFPVETSDYFFGINASYKRELNNSKIESRIRISHISSHLVDGYSNKGIFYKAPFVYSREFVDLYIAYNTNLTQSLSIRPYVGSTLIFSTIPKDVRKFLPQAGVETDYELSDNVKCHIAFDIKSGENALNITSQAGVDLQFHRKFGLRLFYMMYSGNTMHGMFFDEKYIFSAVGFNIIYF